MTYQKRIVEDIRKHKHIYGAALAIGVTGAACFVIGSTRGIKMATDAKHITTAWYYIDAEKGVSVIETLARDGSRTFLTKALEVTP